MDSSAVAQHYNLLQEEDRFDRERSRSIQLRKFNNWVKSVLIQLHTRPGYSALDLACGKGGDIQKWAKARIAKYVGCDIARKSVQRVSDMYNSTGSARFEIKLLAGDCFSNRLVDFLDPETEFDCVSCQFAMHYAFENEERLHTMLENVTVRLKPGGFFFGSTPDASVLVRKLRAVQGLEFGNSIYRVKFDDAYQDKRFPADSPLGVRYHFTLDERVNNVPEYLVHFSSFVQSAAKYNLRLMLLMNFHDFYAEMIQEGRFRELFGRMGVVEEGEMSLEAWDAAYLYAAFAFQRVGAPPYEGNDREMPEKQLSRHDDIILMGDVIE